MTHEQPSGMSELSRDELIQLVGMFFGHLFMHYGMWLTETIHHQRIERALELESGVGEKYFPIAIKRLANHLGMELEGNIPDVLMNKTREDLVTLIQDLAKTWVTGDGLWFQEVERSAGMTQAKEINDACWSHFAQVEAFKILHFLNLEKGGGLNALERALELRLYSTINAHSLSWDPDGTLVFTMTECRVQNSRRRKNMEDYACKSAGLIEYSQFAKGIDKRIQMTCLYCPPDKLTPEQFCSWRFWT